MKYSKFGGRCAVDRYATEEQFYELAARFFGRERSTLGERTRLRRDLKADSLDCLSFVLAAEASFRCRLSDDGLSLAKTLGDFWRVLAEALGFAMEPSRDAPIREQEIYDG